MFVDLAHMVPDPNCCRTQGALAGQSITSSSHKKASALSPCLEILHKHFRTVPLATGTNSEYHLTFTPSPFKIPPYHQLLSNGRQLPMHKTHEIVKMVPISQTLGSLLIT